MALVELHGAPRREARREGADALEGLEGLEGLIAATSPERLRACWAEILCDCRSLTTRQSDAFRLLSAHRAMANFLSSTAAPKSDWPQFGRAAYTLGVMSAFLCVVSSGNDAVKEATRQLVPHLAAEAHVALLEALCQSFCKGEDHDASAVVQAFPQDWLLDACWLLLRIARKSSQLHPSRMPGMLALFKLMLGKVYQACHVREVVDMLLLRKPFDDVIAETVVDSVPDGNDDDGLADTLDLLGSLWGNTLFLARGDVKLLHYVTQAILAAFRRVARSSDCSRWMSRAGSSQVPLVVLFTTGISAVLDSSDDAIRLMGMKVATAMAEINGQTLVFEELVKASLPAVVVQGQAPQEQAQATPPIDVEEIENGNASDADSELEAFDLETDGASSAKDTFYLRSCLELLRHPDTNANAHDKHLQALQSIPSIVATGPLDASDLCSPLIKELIRLGNTFNMERFDSLRGDGMLSLLTTYPHFCAPACTGAIAGEQVMMGAKLLCVNILVKAAHALSGVPYGASARGSSCVLTDKEKKKEGAVESNDSAARVGETRIKRPATLAKGKLKPRLFRNTFGSVAHLFFHPVVSVLSALDGGFNNRGRTDEVDGLECLLPSQLLLALASFTVCAVNTPLHKTFIDESLVTAVKYKEHANLHVRRSALAAALAALDAWSTYREQGRVNASRLVEQGPLATLSNLVGTSRGLEEELSLTDGRIGSTVVSLVDWCLASSQGEVDQRCRDLKVEIARCVMRLDEDPK